MLLWFVMVPVTLIVAPLRTAILYLALMSVWANFATHLGGWISALVNVRAERIDDRSAEHATLAHIEALELQITELLTVAGVTEIHRHVTAICDHLGIKAGVGDPSVP
jgi:hypothetical protein